MKTAWYLSLVVAICFEGMGRKWLPAVPSVAFYLLKDLILLFGYIRFRRPKLIGQVNSWLYRGFRAVWVAGFAWTVIELFNPEHASLMMGAVGMRAYWLWWAAPPLIASVVDDDKEKRRAIYVLLGAAMAISIFAAIQFALPSTNPLNAYASFEGEEIEVATVNLTGRSRVASTFSYVSGFADFTVLVPTLILALGLDARDSRQRKIALIVTCMTAAVLPMSGARAALLLGAGALAISAWSAGLLFTRIGRRIVVGGVAAGIFAVVAFPDAFLGVQSRFADPEETKGRFVQLAATVLPPLAMATYEYPAFGIGTGMMQNARVMLHIPAAYDTEAEAGRFLAELGPVGFLFIWTTKLGLVVAHLRAHRILKRARRRGAGAAGVSYAFLTMIGSLVFDHIWQALYFLGSGLILAEVVSVMRERAVATSAGPAEPEKKLVAA